MDHLEGSHRIRASSSTDEWWLALALGPGLLGGFALRLLFGGAHWLVTLWTLVCLFFAAVGTLWFWARHRTAHLFFLGIYLALAVLVVVLGLVARR